MDREPRPLRRADRCRVPRGTSSAFGRAAFATLICAALAPPVAGQEAVDCGERASLQVIVMDESDTIQLPGAVVIIRWFDETELPVRELVGAAGRFLLCVPEHLAGATMWAEFGDGSSQQAVVGFEPGTTREVVLRVLSENVRPGRLMGQVLDALTEDPVVAAAVSVRGRPVTVETNRQGRFVLTGVPAGDHDLQVRHLGYAPLTYPVTVEWGHTTEAEIGLVPAPVEMEPLVATAIRVRRLEIKGFYERKHWGELLGNGYFFTAEDIDRWRPSSVASFVSMMVPGMSGLANRRMSTGFLNRPCPMNVYLDGIRIRPGELGEFVKPFEVGGIEVYKGPSSLAAEFGGSDARCGAVVVWIK